MDNTFDTIKTFTPINKTSYKLGDVLTSELKDGKLYDYIPVLIPITNPKQEIENKTINIEFSYVESEEQQISEFFRSLMERYLPYKK